MTIRFDPSTGPTLTLTRVGAYGPGSRGPLGTGEWQEEQVERCGRDHRCRVVSLLYQEVSRAVHETATIVANGVEVPVHRATREQLVRMDDTLALVPPGHLELLVRRKPQGFLVSSTTGRGSSLSYTGGLNAGVDYPETADYDERRLILITHGAFWHYRELGICPTAIHELGHVLTHRGEISYGPFPESRATALAGTRASRNPGALEALCNAYMYLICYGSPKPAVRAFGTGGGIQNDRTTRDALRRCRAFTSLLDDTWRGRFAER